MSLLSGFEPVFDKNSRMLILGTFPSVKSREAGFYYANRQNRFWKLLAALFGSEVPDSIDVKKRLLLDNYIALWDVAKLCDINGSSDAAIRNVVPNNLTPLLSACRIKRIFANGRKSEELYNRFMRPVTGMEITCLPSTSPANAAFSFDALSDAWSEIVR